MRWVVSDSSTLIHLAKIGRLGLLQKLYERIIIPPAVWREVVEQGEGRAGAMEVADARQHGWIKVVTPARRIAELYGLSKTGIIGILIRAKREGQISSLQEELEKQRDVAGFWIDETFYQETLSAVGEI